MRSPSPAFCTAAAPAPSHLHRSIRAERAAAAALDCQQPHGAMECAVRFLRFPSPALTPAGYHHPGRARAQWPVRGTPFDGYDVQAASNVASSLGVVGLVSSWAGLGLAIASLARFCGGGGA